MHSQFLCCNLRKNRISQSTTREKEEHDVVQYSKNTQQELKEPLAENLPEVADQRPVDSVEHYELKPEPEQKENPEKHENKQKIMTDPDKAQPKLQKKQIPDVVQYSKNTQQELNEPLAENLPEVADQRLVDSVEHYELKPEPEQKENPEKHENKQKIMTDPDKAQPKLQKKQIPDVVQYSKNTQQELNEPLAENLPEVADQRPVDSVEHYELKPEPEQKENPEKHENKQKIMTDPDKAQPKLQKKQIPAEFPCLYGFGKSKWPIHCYAKLGFNINAQHGGCAGLILVSNSYGSDGSNTTAEILFLTTGFDANHFSVTSIGKSNAGHFGAENEFVTDEQGNLIGSHMFGSNHVMLMTNYGCYGNLKHGVYVKGPPGSDDLLNLPLNVNGSLNGEHGAGVTLVLCSNSEHSAMYMIRSGHEGDYLEMVHLSGDNIWKFSAAGGGLLQVTGAGNSNYGIFHNRQNLIKDEIQARARTCLAQAIDGSHITTLISSMPVHATYIVMCSCSNGTEDNTAGALYHISIESSNLKVSKCMTGSHGNCYENFDLWKFYVSSGKLVVTGPSGPCRYALLSDSKDDGNGGEDVDSLTGCLATGEPHKIQGAVRIADNEIVGVVDRPSKIIIQADVKILGVFEADELERIGDLYTFRRTWKEKEKTVGVHLVKIFAVRKHVTSGNEVFINLEGSPQKLIRQKAGVIYALNAGGPDYHALSNIIYTSEFSHFASFTYDVCYGTRCKALGGVKTPTNIPQILCNTHDGFLNCTTRSPGVEPQDEQKVNWVIEDISNGKYRIRVHMNSKVTRNLMVNGIEISDQMTKEFVRCKPSGDILSGHEYTSYYGDVPVTVHDNRLELYAVGSTMISGFALLDSAYKTLGHFCDAGRVFLLGKDEKMTEEEMKEEEKVKLQLSEQIQTIKRVLLRKKITLVGWSQNLLQNASGENSDLSHWNTTGSWEIHEGGYQTEKAFVTSHMECEKYQEVRLTDYFSAKYLDTAPDIQVSEWYREGVCGGGFYSMEASILDEHGNVIKSFSTGQIGTIYKNNAWQNASVTFSSYGPGARIVTISSTGRDDKFWGGHYGVMISASIIRVKREELRAEGDEFEDIKQDQVEYTAIKVANDVLSENQTLLKEVLEESNVPLDTQFEKQTAVLSARRQTKMKRKHEIRVFVSSTFRDFTREREKIIKKTFREMNQICTDHGVFFTYVDLRWGITKEQTNDGKTIAICLQEIDRCRPYFICLLGERFGWCQTREKPDELLNNSYNYALDNFPPLSWIDHNRYDTSVTQLEVMHGVLNDIQNRKTQHSFFYIREPIDPATVTKEEYEIISLLKCCFDPRFILVHSLHTLVYNDLDWILSHFPNQMNEIQSEKQKMAAESAYHKEKQMALINTVRIQKDLNIRDFKTPEDVCELIKNDLVLCVEQDFPMGTEPTNHEKQRMSHGAFAENRQHVFVGRQEYIYAINEQRAKNLNTPFVILGESGSGKSAIVANWAKEIEEQEADTFLFVHFIGSTAESALYLKIIRRICEEIKDYFKIDQAIPSTDTHLIQDLGKWIHMAGTRAKCIFILDALNQLNDGTGDEGPEHDLMWIPSEIPPNVFFLMSTLPGRAMEAVKKFEWPTVHVGLLKTEEKEEYILKYLTEIYGKTLDQEQKDRIIKSPNTDNPLFMKVLLDEVRMYGSFSTLSQYIKDCLALDAVSDLFSKFIERLEEEFEKGVNSRKNIVHDVLTAVWCASRGLTESEIKEFLNISNQLWSPFYISLSGGLINRNGILNFSHDHMRQAVEKQYLSTTESKKQIYLRLSDYFSHLPLSGRVVEELPNLLLKAGEMDRLKITISNLEVFSCLMKSEDGKFELIKAWQSVGDVSLTEEAYLKEVEKMDPQELEQEKCIDLFRKLGSLFIELGLLESARKIYEKLFQTLEKMYSASDMTVVYNPFNQSWKYRCKHPDVIYAMYQLGVVYKGQWELDKAVEIYKEAISRQIRIKTPQQKLQLCEGLLSLATVFYLQNNMPEAKKLLVRSLELATDVLGRRHHYVAAIFNKLGQLCYQQGRIDEGLGYFLQDLKLTRSENGMDHPLSGAILNDIALVYDDKADKLARPLYQNALLILKKVYGPMHIDVATVRYNLGANFFATNYFARAKFQFLEAHRVFRTFLGDDHPNTIAAKEALEAIGGSDS